MSRILERNCMNGMTYSSTEFFAIFNLYKFGVGYLDTAMLLLDQSRFEECFGLLRTVFETYMHLLLVTRMKKFRETLPHRVSSGNEAPGVERDKVYEKWLSEWKSGNPNYREVINIQKGRRKDTILVTYEREGVYSADDPERKDRPISRQLFAIDEYDPEDRFVSSLPGIIEGDPWAKVGEARIEDQKRTYNEFMYVDSLVKKLKLNGIISVLERTRIVVHYSYLSSFTHPTRTALSFGQEMGHLGANEQTLTDLILHYTGKFHQLLLSAVSEFFSILNKMARLENERELEAHLKTATRDLWFIFDEPTDYDKWDSDNRKMMVKEVTGKIVDPELVLYYTNPLRRLASLRLFQRNRPGVIPPWFSEVLKEGS